MQANFDLNKISGLSEELAAERLAEEGYNELPSAKKRSILAIALEVVREPMFLLLVAGGSIYFILGDIQEALMLLGFVCVVMGITLYQERKTERALEALSVLSSPRALVIRDGQQRRLAAPELVRGDIIVLAEGDRVPADAVLLSTLNFSVDESLLTGEAVPVRKVAGHSQQAMGKPGGDDQPFVFSGTLVVQGQGVAEVQATGIRTEMGKIGKALQTLTTQDTLLQQEINRLVGKIALVGLLLCLIVILAYGLSKGNWLEGILAGITLAMAILPEEFPVVLTIFLALGAWRISQKRVLTRRMPAVETLGSATVLCVDKTGTLTLNRMTVSKLFAGEQFYDLTEYNLGDIPEGFHELLEFSILASQKDPFDPMEKAFKQLGDKALGQTEHLHEDWQLVREYPLSQSLLAISHVWNSPDGQHYVIAAKGAPEAILDLCHLEATTQQELLAKSSTMAAEGLRILGVAKALFQKTDLPGEQHDFKFEFLGLVGLADPVRPAVAGAIRECYQAGIKVAMITGDYPVTAQSIARQIGLNLRKTSSNRPPENAVNTGYDHEHAVITGPELDQLEDAELQQRIQEVNIFARVVPEQKLRLVNAFKQNGQIVAMTGDGVNDAPALKAAHIGVAMGSRGTDVAREASALVLLDDDFSSIVQAVKMGRRIFDNLKKAMAYIFAVHVPIAGMSLIPVMFNWPLVLMPVHIVFLELIIDPACSIVFEAEPEEANIMNRPPHNPHDPLFGKQTIVISLLQGLSVLLIVLAVFVIALQRGQGDAEARTLAFTTLVIANLGLIFTNRSWSRTVFETLRTPNTALWWVLAGTVTFLALVLYVPFLRNLFHFGFLHPVDLLICLIAGTVSITWFELIKLTGIKKNP